MRTAKTHVRQQKSGSLPQFAIGTNGSAAVKVEGLDNPDVQEAIVRERVRTARVARLATTDPDGRPHLVPIVFVLDGQTLYSAVDAKPKRSRRLRRLANARERPDVTVLVDHYEDDWGRLWWVSLRDRRGCSIRERRPSGPSGCSSISTSSTDANLPAARCSPSTFSSGAAGTPWALGAERVARVGRCWNATLGTPPPGECRGDGSPFASSPPRFATEVASRNRRPTPSPA